MDLTSGYPFWLIKHGLPFDYEKLETNFSTDVVILGGGITGALMSYHLTIAGISNAVIDGRTIGLGSSCASTALLQYEIDTPLCDLKNKVGLYNAIRAYRLCDESINALEEIAKKIKFAEFTKLKSLYYAVNNKDKGFIQEEFDMRAQHGFDVELLNEAALKKYIDIVAPNAILSAQAAQTNAYSFAHALHQFSIKKGAKVFDRTLIKTIHHTDEGVVCKTADGHIIKSKKFIYASGYESIQYINKKIVTLHSTYAVCTEQGGASNVPFKNKTLVWNTASPYLYMRTTPDDRILIGGRDEAFYDVKKRDALMPKKTKQLVNDFENIYPSIDFKQEFSWCGTFAETKDGLPYIGEYKGLPNCYFALGFGGNGITFSQIAAEIIRDLILQKKNNDAEIFSFNR